MLSKTESQVLTFQKVLTNITIYKDSQRYLHVGTLGFVYNISTLSGDI